MVNRTFLRKNFSYKIRRIFLRILHAVVFLGVMASVFHLTFNVIGEALQKLLAQWISAASFATANLLDMWNTPLLLRALLLEGIFPGVGSVLSFAPVIGTLFFFLSLLEESGYLSHVAAVMDKPMRRIGLTGHAVVPLISGFGCNVPAIMTAGSMLTGRERTTVVMMVPFLSCSARLPIFALFIGVFFPDSNAVILTMLYLVSIAAAVSLAILLKLRFTHDLTPQKHTCCKTCPSSVCTATCSPDKAIMDIFCTALLAARENGLAFVKKAFTIILAASVIVWFLQSFDSGLHPVPDSEGSLLAYLGKAAAPIFAPLGFGDWRAAAALISGLFAKEAVVSTLAVMSSAPALSSMLPTLFTPLSAFSFMTFCLLYTPCIATFTAVKQILGAKKAVLLSILQLTVAWTVSFLLFQIGTV